MSQRQGTWIAADRAGPLDNRPHIDQEFRFCLPDGPRRVTCFWMNSRQLGAQPDQGDPERAYFLQERQVQSRIIPHHKQLRGWAWFQTRLHACLPALLEAK